MTALSTEQADRLKRQATYAAIGVSSILIVIKLSAWMLSDSIAILSSLVDSILDAATSIMIFIAVRTAAAPPDSKHRFGHDKAEAIAALLQGAFIIGSAIFLIIEASRRFFFPRFIENETIAIACLVVSLIMTAGLLMFQRYVVKRTQSLAIRADQTHYQMDLFVNIALIGGIWMTQTHQGLSWIDPLMGIAIALYLIREGYRIADKAGHELMDAEIPHQKRQMIKKIVQSHPEVVDMHDLRTRRAGTSFFIQMHLELNGSLPLREAHDITDQIETKIKSAFPQANITIHQEPAGIEDEKDDFKEL